MRLYIPACGDRITLSAPWTFTLVLEHRNVEFAKTRKVVDPSAPRYGNFSRAGYEKVSVTLDAGTVLECDRVYIRTFNKSRIRLEEDYDSVTWKVFGANGKAVKKSRFWTKLTDANLVEHGEVDLYRDRVKLAKLIMES